MTTRSVDILLVEDNPGDVRLTREAFAEGPLAVNLSVVPNGVEALAFLRREEPYTNAPHPELILLDLNLPRVDGRQVLAQLKADRRLRRIPVVILTTSTAEADIMQTYDLRANCYIAKPVDLEQFFTVVREIEDFWLTVVTRSDA